jgi:hypothetical protein
MYHSDNPCRVGSVERPGMRHARRFGALEGDLFTCGAPQKANVDVTSQRLQFNVRYFVRFLWLYRECDSVLWSET